MKKTVYVRILENDYGMFSRMFSGEVIELKKEMAMTRSRPGVSQVKRDLV